MTSSRRVPVDFLKLDAALRQTLDDLKKQQKIQKLQHNTAMVAYRKAKKEKQKLNHSVLHQLERQLKQLVECVRAAAARSSQEQQANQTPAEALRGLVAEQEILRNENVALREEIGRLEMFRLSSHVLLSGDTPPPTILQLIQYSEQFCEELSQDASSLWRVVFDRNIPSFHFNPFTRDDFDEEMNQFDLELALSASSLSVVGEFLGWGVHHAPLVASPMGSTLARVRLAKRVCCTFDILLSIPYTKEKDWSPIIVSPIGFGIHQRYEVSTQLLQEFDQDALVFAHHIPSPGKTSGTFTSVDALSGNYRTEDANSNSVCPSWTPTVDAMLEDCKKMSSGLTREA